jgi:phosphatidate cytidylyltransferase
VNPTLLVIGGLIYGLLVIATVTTLWVLHKNPDHTTFKKVKVIVKSWWYIVSFILACFATAPWGLLIGFAGISFLGAREYLRHSKLQSFKPFLLVVIALFLAGQYLALGLHRFDVFQVMPLVFILSFFPALVIASGQVQNLPLIFSSLVGPLLFFHCLAHLPALYILGVSSWKNESQALAAIFGILFLTEINDILQFIFGKAFGRRKIVPLISPNKTEAGFIFGILGTTTLGAIGLSATAGLSLFEAAALGFLISLFGIIGDLFFSSVKRYLQTKDFSDALPGHGGFLDRLDSLFLTAPIAFYAFWYLRGV